MCTFLIYFATFSIVQLEMQELGHTFTRIDGSMKPADRIDAMEKFSTKKCDSQRTPRFILCSLHACGTGINLERGSVAFMLDPWVSRRENPFHFGLSISEACSNRVFLCALPTVESRSRKPGQRAHPSHFLQASCPSVPVGHGQYARTANVGSARRQRNGKCGVLSS